MLWFDATNDFDPTFVEELRMGFGGSPNSKIAQRFSNVMMHEFAKRFAAFVTIPRRPCCRGFNSPLSTGGALMRAPGLSRILCKADSGLSAMIGILVAISSHLVARYEDTFLYLLLSNSAPIVIAPYR